MISPPAGVRIWLAAGATVMRRGFDGLASLVAQQLNHDPFSGQIFAFRGRRGHLIKLLFWDGQGLVLYAKRLERGHFVWPSASETVPENRPMIDRRKVVTAGAALAAFGFTQTAAAARPERIGPMRIRRLGWAGVEIECDDETLLIDYVQDISPMAPLLRRPDEPFPASSRPETAAAALLTHLHADHADPDALAVSLRKGAPVFRPAAATGTKDDVELTSIGETKFTHSKLAAEVVGAWEERTVGPFKMYSVPAVDGFGDPQHSWIVECGGRRIIHAGDTLNHGNWWRIAHRFGSFDAAFLPINAPVCAWPHFQPPSPIEATMTPEEAAVAAHIIGAKSVTPIHYGSLNKAVRYEETQHPVERLRAKTSEFGVFADIREPGDWFTLT